MNNAIADIRKEYQMQSLLEADTDPDAIRQFTRWWNDAVKSEIEEINAMTLATASVSGIPSARIVLLKSMSEKGFVFFTNYNSQKGIELQENPNACLVFFWKELERQIKIVGTVEKLSASESDDYFNSRPEGSKVGAWASPQSNVIESRDVLTQNLEKYEKQFADGSISRPLHWGGFNLVPSKIEFWQGRPNRLHDRIQYTRIPGDGWKIERLAP